MVIRRVDARSQQRVPLVDESPNSILRARLGRSATVRPASAARQLCTLLRSTFLIEPKTRFEGQVGEQATLFVLDPSGNALEFKSFKDSSRLFRS